MEVSDKTKFQYALANYWVKKGKRGTYELATASGKARIGCILIKYMLDEGAKEVLIITPTEPIRDQLWPTEIEKWIGKEYLKKVNIECINSVYKARNEEFEFVIADEFHNYMPETEEFIAGIKEYVKFFTHNKINALLGLTAFIDKSRRPTIESIAPILYTLSIDEALRRGFISNFMIYNVPVKFTVKEQDEYDAIQVEYKKYEAKLGGSYVAYSNASGILKAFRGLDITSLDQKNKIKYGLANAYMKRMNQRKSYLYTATNKIHACNRIVDAYSDKCIVFSASKVFANAYNKHRKEHEDTVPIHSGISKVKRGQYLKEFAKDDSTIRVLSAVRAINEGIDVPRVKLSVLVNGTGKRLELVQRLGRNLRLDGRPAVLAQLYVPNTQDETWMYSRVYGISKEKVVKLNSVDEFLAVVNNFAKWKEGQN